LKRHPRAPRPAFTLIELLVVISLIGLIMAILLPALRAARQTAQRIQCASQLRQNGVFHLMYADAHAGWFPITRWNQQAMIAQDSSSPGAVAARSILPWYGGRIRQFVCPTNEYLATTTSSAAGYERSEGPYWFVITSYRYVAIRGDYTHATAAYFGVTNNSAPATRNDFHLSPGIPNLNFAGRSVTYPRTGRTHFLHPPTMMPMMLDGYNPGANQTWAPHSSLHRNNHFGTGGVNIMFLDGHGIWALQSDENAERIRLGTSGVRIRWP